MDIQYVGGGGGGLHKKGEKCIFLGNKLFKISGVPPPCSRQFNMPGGLHVSQRCGWMGGGMMKTQTIYPCTAVQLYCSRLLIFSINHVSPEKEEHMINSNNNSLDRYSTRLLTHIQNVQDALSFFCGVSIPVGQDFLDKQCGINF